MDDFGFGGAKSVWSVWEDDLWRPCFQDAGDDEGKKLLCYIKLIIPFIVLLVVTIIAFLLDAIVEFVNWFAGLFNATDDDNARRDISEMSCDEIAAQPDERLSQWTEAMLDGPTLDDDERALIKVVSCLPCDRLRSFYWPRFGDRIWDDTHGSEFDELQVALLRCNLIRLSEWDDDATRRFINQNNCDVLGSLSADDYRSLFNNLFSGTTGDDDERAIIKITRCIPVGTMVDILSTPGFKRGDFDDEVDGSEWRTLKQVWADMGITFS